MTACARCSTELRLLDGNVLEGIAIGVGIALLVKLGELVIEQVKKATEPKAAK